MSTAEKTLTAVEIAKDLGATPKYFRKWLRDEYQGGKLPVIIHDKGDDWLFTQEQALYVVMHFRVTKGQIDVALTYKQLTMRR